MSVHYLNNDFRIKPFVNFLTGVRYELQKKKYFLGLIPYWDRASDYSISFQRIDDCDTVIELEKILMRRYEDDLEKERIKHKNILA